MELFWELYSFFYSYYEQSHTPLRQKTLIRYDAIPCKAQSYQWKLFWSLHMKASKIIQWRIMNGTERETLRSSLWDMWISLKLHLDQLNAWINRKLVSGEVRNFCSVLSRENSTVASTLFWIFCFEAVVRKLDDVSNNRLKFGDIPWIRFRLITTSKNNFNKIHILGQRLKIPSLSDYSLLVYLDDDGGDDDDNDVVW